MMAAQGILGLITGGGSWLASGITNTTRVRMNDVRAILEKGRPWSGVGRRRVFVKREEGVVFAQSPRGFVWPDLIMVNGTNFTVVGEGGEVYRSEGGGVIDFRRK